MSKDSKKFNSVNPLISIITVIYNGDRYFEQTIKSVIGQTYKNIEYIIIDGGSTDGTHDIVSKYEKHISCFVSEPDEGLYDAMNKGISLAKGQLVGMINSDDWYELNAVELMVDAYRNNPEKTIFHADRFDINSNEKKELRKFNPSAFKFKYIGMTYNHPSMFVAKSEYERHQYKIDLSALSDYLFVLESFLFKEDAIFYVEKPIVNYRLDGISAQLSLMKRLEEGFSARRIAKMGMLENIFSVLLRATIFSIKKFIT